MNQQSQPLPTLSRLVEVAQISAGGEHTCAVDRDGAIRCAGFNRRGQLGDGRRVTFGDPQQVHGVTAAVDVVAGGAHTCASQMDGTVKCWGNNDEGQVGEGSFANDRTTPQVVSGILSPKEMFAGADHTCALLADDTVYCWGFNGEGRLGDNTLLSSPHPRRVVNLTDTPRKLAHGDRGTCVMVDGGARCWGNQFGMTPQLVSGVANISTGQDHVCKVESDATVMCYGAGSNYQLGNNMNVMQTAPGVDAIGVTGAREVQTRGHSSCAVMMDGTVKCWGLNDGGRLGVGNTNYQVQMPLPINGLTGITKLAMGWEASCALKSDSSIWCWGASYYGHVGDSSYATRTSPVQISAFVGAKDVASGGSHACAIDAAGNVWCWGAATAGQLGNGRRIITRPVGVRMTCP
jgi:alpha-tubulin suppressor-like RCC1 family protein